MHKCTSTIIVIESEICKYENIKLKDGLKRKKKNQNKNNNTIRPSEVCLISYIYRYSYFYQDNVKPNIVINIFHLLSLCYMKPKSAVLIPTDPDITYTINWSKLNSDNISL